MRRRLVKKILNQCRSSRNITNAEIHRLWIISKRKSEQRTRQWIEGEGSKYLHEVGDRLVIIRLGNAE